MAPPNPQAPTADQLEAERRRKEEEQRNMLMSLLQWGWDHISDFFTLLIGAILIYAVAHTVGRSTLEGWLGKDTVDDVMDGIDSMLAALFNKFGIEIDISDKLNGWDAPTAQKKLVARGVPQDVAALLAPDTATWKRLVNDVKAVNGGKVLADSFTNEKTLLMLLTSPGYQPMVAKMLPLLRQGDNAQSSMAGQIMQSLTKLVNDTTPDPTTKLTPLDRLLTDGTTRTLMVKALLAMKPDLGVKSEDIERAIQRGITSGKVTPELRQLIGTGLTGKPEDFQAAVKTYVSAKFGADEVVSMVDPKTMPVATPTEKQQQATVVALQTPEGKAALKTLSAALGSDAPKLTAALVQEGDRSAALLQVARQAKPGAMPAFIALAQLLPTEVKAGLPINPDKIARMVETVGADRPVMQQFFAAMQKAIPAQPNDTVNMQAMAPAFVKLVCSNEVAANPDARRALVALVQDQVPTNKKDFIAQQGEQVLKLMGILGEEKATTLMSLLTKPQDEKATTTDLIRFALKPENNVAFGEMMALAAKLPGMDVKAVEKAAEAIGGLKPEMRIVLSRMVDRMPDPMAVITQLQSLDAKNPDALVQWLLEDANRKLVRDAGVKDIAALAVALGTPAMVSEKNLNALLAFSEAVATNPANQGKSAGTARDVLSVILQLAQGDMNGVNGLDKNGRIALAAKLSVFFRDGKNVQVVNELLKGIDPTGLDASQRNILTAFSDNFVTPTGGLSAVLGKTGSALYLLRKMANDPDASSDTAIYLGRLFSGSPEAVIYANQDALTALANAFKSAKTASDPKKLSALVTPVPMEAFVLPPSTSPATFPVVEAAMVGAPLSTPIRAASLVSIPVGIV